MERCSHHWCIRLWSVTISFFPSVHVCPSCDACWPMLGDRSFWMVLISTLFTPFLKRQQHFLGLSNSAPTSAPSEKSSSGISWMGWNILRLGQHHFFFLLGLFFLFYNFFFFFFFFLMVTVFFLSCFFWSHPWPQIYFGNLLPPPLTNPPTSFSTHLHC
jgi:hypothetical protein